MKRRIMIGGVVLCLAMALYWPFLYAVCQSIVDAILFSVPCLVMIIPLIYWVVSGRKIALVFAIVSLSPYVIIAPPKKSRIGDVPMISCVAKASESGHGNNDVLDFVSRLPSESALISPDSEFFLRDGDGHCVDGTPAVFADITLTKCNGHDSCVTSTLLSALQRILTEEKDNVAVDSCVLHFNAGVFLLDESLQNELQTALARTHPNEMSDALKSAGNIHNPKLYFLYTALKPAIMDTPSMKELSRIAHSYGYDATIQCLGGEKLQFRQEDSNGKAFVNPHSRIYGIWGFSARKSDWKDKKTLNARIVDINEQGTVLFDKIEIIEKNRYW